MRCPECGVVLKFTVVADSSVVPPSVAEPSLSRQVAVQADSNPSVAGPSSRWPSVPGYEVLGEMGRGSMGVVHRARQRELGRDVALKMILHGSHSGPGDL